MNGLRHSPALRAAQLQARVNELNHVEAETRNIASLLLRSDHEELADQAARVTASIQVLRLAVTNERKAVLGDH